ncbi:MAG: PD40 domain-containing protein, partial [Acidobacteriota bacterium]|nr:PD40 domain-containing protein [Acidobacteriota bacterium]
LERILASREFANAERLGRFLRYVVERTLAGDRDSLKESVIGIEVFGRSPDYDPKSEPIVRTEARRLRARLDEYYQDSSRSPKVRILMPKGSYVGLFEPVLDEPLLPGPAPADPPVCAPVPKGIRKGRLAIWAACGALAVASALFLNSRPRPPVLDHAAVFTTQHGVQTNARLSPAGDLLAFSWRSPQDLHAAIYVQRLDATTPVRVTQGALLERCPAWSRDGSRIAFLRDIDAERFAIFTRPLVGARERKWVEFRRGATPWLDWSPDERWFAIAEPVVPGRRSSIVLISLVTGEKRILTVPPAGWRGDSLPVFSPDSSKVVFRRTQPPSGQEDLYEVPVAGGTPTRLTFDNRGISGEAFTPDGGLAVSSRRAGSIRSLWWLPPGGGPLLRLSSAVIDAGYPTVSRDGRRFAFSRLTYDVNIWRVNANGSTPATPFIDSELADTSPEFSRDGRIVFVSDRSGISEIWVCAGDGSNAIRLTDGGGAQLGNPHWSPDGQQVLFEWHKSGRAAVYLVSIEGGPVRAVVEDQYQNQLPSWSRDGRSIYFASNRSGEMRIWKVAAAGGAPVQVTASPGFASAESPDGKYLFWTDPTNANIWRQPLSGGVLTGTASQVVGGRTIGDWGNWVLGRKGIYYIRRRPKTDDAAIEYLDFARGPARTVYVLSKPPMYGGGGLALSPDETVLLFAQVDRDEENIFVQ